MVLLAVVLAFCRLVVPASAAEADSYEGYVAEGVSITRIGDVASPRWGGEIYSLMPIIIECEVLLHEH